MKKNRFIPIGKIVGTHGLYGTCKVYSYAESLSVFKPKTLIRLRQNRGEQKIHEIKWAKPHSKGILLALKKVTNRDQAQRLIGSEICIERRELPEIEPGSYYWCDIIGLSVFSTEGKYIGRVTSIIATGSNDVYVVENPDNSDKNEVLIPAIESVVRVIDVEKQILEVDLPEGL